MKAFATLEQEKGYRKDRLEPARYWTLGVFLFAFLFPLLFAWNGKKSDLHPVFGVMRDGSQLVFTKGRAAAYFSTSFFEPTGLRFFKEGKKEYRLALIVNGIPDPEVIRISPGVTTTWIPRQKGPVYVEFLWNEDLSDDLTQPDQVVFLTRPAPLESRLFHAVLVLSGILAFLYLLLRSFRGKKDSVRTVFLLLTIIYASFYYTIYTMDGVGLIGDEPAHLLIAESIALDRDIDLRNQFTELHGTSLHRDALHSDQYLEIGGRLLSKHFPGLGAVLAPAFSASRTGWQTNPIVIAKGIVIGFSALFTAFFLVVVFRIFSGRMVRFFSFLLLSGLPFLHYTHQIYPETLAGIIAFFLFVRAWFDSPRNRFLELAVILFLPFLHRKFAPAAFLFGLLQIYNLRKQTGKAISVFALLSIEAVVFLLFSQWMYGGFLGGYDASDLLVTDLPIRYFGYLFDADRGLFLLSPLLLFGIPGLLILLRREAAKTVFLVAIIGSLHLPNLFHSVFWLGTCPYGRYWVAVYPLLAFAALFGIDVSLRRNLRERNGFARFAGGGERYVILPFLSFLSLLQLVAFLSGPENFFSHFDRHRIAATFLTGKLGVSLEWLYPLYPFSDSMGVLFFWMFLALFLAFSGAYSIWHDRIEDLPERNT